MWPANRLINPRQAQDPLNSLFSHTDAKLKIDRGPAWSSQTGLQAACEPALSWEDEATVESCARHDVIQMKLGIAVAAFRAPRIQFLLQIQVPCPSTSIQLQEVIPVRHFCESLSCRSRNESFFKFRM